MKREGWEQLFALVFIMPPVFLAIGSLIPLGEQVMAWLKTGYVPPRDLYWLVSQANCLD